jgi:hypothetical protein
MISTTKITIHNTSNTQNNREKIAYLPAQINKRKMSKRRRRRRVTNKTS